MLKQTWNTFLADNPSESEVRAFLLSRLGEYFEIAEEVSGRHLASGKRQQLDAVLTMKDNPQISFGIEFKRLLTARQPVNVLSQVSAYVNTEWNTFGRLPVFLCPDPFDPEVLRPKEWQDETHTAAFRLIDMVLIGGVRFSNKAGITFFGRGGNAWSENFGLTKYGRALAEPRQRESVRVRDGAMLPPRQRGGYMQHRYQFDAKYQNGVRVERRQIAAKSKQKLLDRIKDEVEVAG